MSIVESGRKGEGKGKEGEGYKEIHDDVHVHGD